MPDLHTIDIATAEASVFRPYLNEAFTLRCGAGAFPVRLIDISEYPDHRPANGQSGRRPFGLVFRCDQGVLAQGIYTVEHAGLRACGLFLSPFEGGDGWCKLEAVFN